MEPKQLITKAQIVARYGVSGKICNAGDGLLWPTKGHFSNFLDIVAPVPSLTCKAIPSQQFVNAVNLVIGNAAENIFEPSSQIKAH